MKSLAIATLFFGLVGQVASAQVTSVYNQYASWIQKSSAWCESEVDYGGMVTTSPPVVANLPSPRPLTWVGAKGVDYMTAAASSTSVGSASAQCASVAGVKWEYHDEPKKYKRLHSFGLMLHDIDVRSSANPIDTKGKTKAAGAAALRFASEISTYDSFTVEGNITFKMEDRDGPAPTGILKWYGKLGDSYLTLENEGDKWTVKGHLYKPSNPTNYEVVNLTYQGYSNQILSNLKFDVKQTYPEKEQTLTSSGTRTIDQKVKFGEAEAGMIDEYPWPGRTEPTQMWGWNNWEAVASRPSHLSTPGLTEGLYDARLQGRCEVTLEKVTIH